MDQLVEYIVELLTKVKHRPYAAALLHCSSCPYTEKHLWIDAATAWLHNQSDYLIIASDTSDKPTSPSNVSPVESPLTQRKRRFPPHLQMADLDVANLRPPVETPLCHSWWR